MAIATISNTGGLYSASSSWVGNFVPTSVDDVTSTVTSGPLIVDVPSAARSVNFGPYTSTLTMNSGLTVSGNVTLGLTMSISGTFGMVVNSSATMSSNGLTWSNPLTFTGTNNTYTFFDDWFISGLIIFNGTTQTTLNGKIITASGGIRVTSIATILGTTGIKITGGTWSHTSTGAIRNNLSIDGNCNFGTSIYYNTGTFSYLSGVVGVSGSTFYVGANTNFSSTNGFDFDSFYTTAVATLNGSDINLLKNLTVGNTTTGTSKIVMKGTGVWSASGYLGNNIDFNAPGNTITLSGNIYYYTGTMSYIAGTVSASSATLWLNAGGNLGLSLGDTITFGTIYTYAATTTINLANTLRTSILYVGLTGDINNTVVTITGTYGVFVSNTFNFGNGFFNGNRYNPPWNTYLTMSNTITTSNFYVYHGSWASGVTLVSNINSLTGGTISVSGVFTNSFNNQQNITTLYGTTEIYMTGTLMNYAGVARYIQIQPKLTLNPSTTLSLSLYGSALLFAGSELKYLGGTVSWNNHYIQIGSSANITTNSTSRWYYLYFTGGTSTLVNDCNVDILGSGGAVVVNSNKFNVNSSLVINGEMSGSSLVLVNGTGSQVWSATSYLNNNLTINKPSGTFSLSGNVYYQSGTLSYVAGSYSTTGSTLNLGNSCVLDSNGLVWNNVTNTTTATVSLPTDLSWSGTYSITGGTIGFTGSGSLTASSTGNLLANGSSTTNFKNDIQVVNATLGPATLNRNIIYLTGNLNTTGNTSGTSSIIMIGLGTQTWSSSANAYLGNNLQINKPSGILNVSGNVYYQTGTFSYLSGSVSTTNSTLNIGNSCFLQTNPIQWFNFNTSVSSAVNLLNDFNWTGTWSSTTGTITFTGSGLLKPTTTSNINFSGTSIITVSESVSTSTMSLITLTTTGPTTLRSNISCNSLLTLGTTVVNSASGFTGSITTNGGLSVTGNASGTAPIIIKGGTWSATNYLNNNLRFEGNSAVSGNVYYQSGTMSYINGSVSTANSTVNIGSSCRLDTNGINWNNFTFIGGTTTVLSNLNLSGTLRTQTAVITLNSFSASVFKIFTNSISINAPTNGNAELVFNTPTTGTWSHATDQYLTNNLTFNHTGVVNMSGNIYYYGGTVSHITGSVSSGSSVVYMPGSTTLDTASMIWNEIRNWNTMNLILKAPINMNLWTINWATFTGTDDGYRDNLESFARAANVTVVGTHSINISNLLTVGFRGWGLLYANQWPTILNLASNLEVPNLLIWLSGARNPQNNPFVGHTVTMNNFSTTVTETFVVRTGPLGSWPGVPALRGTTEIIIKGSTWSMPNTNPLYSDMIFYYEVPITIQSSNLNIVSTNLSNPSTIYFNYKTFKYISGTISTQMAFHFSNANLDLNNYRLNNILLSGNTTLLGNLNVINLTASSISLDTDSISTSSLTTLSSVSILGTGSVTVDGNLGINVTTSGKDISLTGTSSGNWTHGSAVYLSNNLLINKSSGNLSVSGNVYYQSGTLSYISGTVSTGSSTLNIGGNTNLQTSPIRWFNVNNAQAASVNLINDLYWTGTWSATTGTITLTGPGLISPTASSRINFSGTSNVIIPDSVLGTTMSSITLTTSGTTQLRGTISCSELLTLGGSGAINNASGFTGSIRTIGGLSMTGNASGTATINLMGGTWSSTGVNYLLTNLNLDGDIRIGSNIYYATGTMSYISGKIDTSTNFSTLTIGGTTIINTSNVNWYNVYFVTANATINLKSDLLVNNIFRITQVSQTFTTNTNSVINCGHFQYVITSSTTHDVNMANIPIYTKDFTASGLGSGAALSINNNTFVSGDLTITGGLGHLAHLYGGTISMVGSGTITTTSALKSNLIINTGGKINITGTYFLGSFGPSGMGGANMTYIKGNVVAKGSTLSMVTNASYPYVLTGMNKINWKSVLVTSGANITMDEFFSGSPDVKTTILPSSTGTYSVTFTDNFEKVARYVNPTNLWVRPGQLLITTDGKKNFSTNRGIRYINSSPNGLSKKSNTIQPQLGTFLLNDPTMTKF